MLVLETVDQVELGANGPLGAWWRFLHAADDIGSGTSLVGQVHDLHRALGVDDDPNVWLPLPPGRHVLWQEALVDSTPAAPEQDAGLLQGSRLVTARGATGVPQQHLLQRNTHPLGRVASQVLIGKEEDAGSAVKRPREGCLRVRRGTDQPSVPPTEPLQVGGGIDVGYRHHLTFDVHHLTQLCPRPLHILQAGHSSQRTASFQVGYEHSLSRLGQYGSRLGHKVDATKDDVLGVTTIGGVAGQLERVAPKVSELDDLLLLVVVAQNHQLVAQLKSEIGY